MTISENILKFIYNTKIKRIVYSIKITDTMQIDVEVYYAIDYGYEIFAYKKHFKQFDNNLKVIEELCYKVTGVDDNKIDTKLKTIIHKILTGRYSLISNTIYEYDEIDKRIPMIYSCYIEYEQSISYRQITTEYQYLGARLIGKVETLTYPNSIERKNYREVSRYTYKYDKGKIIEDLCDEKITVYPFKASETIERIKRHTKEAFVVNTSVGTVTEEYYTSYGKNSKTVKDTYYDITVSLESDRSKIFHIDSRNFSISQISTNASYTCETYYLVPQFKINELLKGEMKDGDSL